MEILTSAIAFLVAISVLIAVHEFGHFWVARKLGVKVLRYSIGFGKPLWKKTLGKDRTEVVVAALPLGGYVKMLDEREGPVPDNETARAFNRQSVATRFAIVFAGPAFNFLFAIVAYWMMFVVGINGVKPVVGEVIAETPAARAGLQRGQEIVAVDGQATPIWDVAIQKLVPAMVDRGHVTLEVRTGQEATRTVQLDLSGIKGDLEPGELFNTLGMKPDRPRLLPVVGEVVAGSAAERAGLERGDRILSIDGTGIDDWPGLVEYVSARPDQAMQLLIQRDGAEQYVPLHTDTKQVDDKIIGRMGIGPLIPEQETVLYRYSLFESVGMALGQTWDSTLLTLKMFGKILTGDISIKNLSGPIRIAEYAGYSATAGFARFMDFLAIVSLSLGVLNLLPIPILDGGHLMYYIVEIVKGSPVSDTAMEIGQRIGIVLLLMLMSIAFYNDIINLLN
ncbi:MAG: RIP metalloprotease RseP [Proteobacteria bacterium]|nr:RIP metalloprotease RseP [Pseudomonadota bacterium]